MTSIPLHLEGMMVNMTLLEAMLLHWKMIEMIMRKIMLHTTFPHQLERRTRTFGYFLLGLLE